MEKECFSLLTTRTDLNHRQLHLRTETGKQDISGMD